MLKVGDRVKTLVDTDGMSRLYPIGTVGIIIDIVNDNFYEVITSGDKYGFWYLENKLEKGRLEWIKDE